MIVSSIFRIGARLLCRTAVLCLRSPPNTVEKMVAPQILRTNYCTIRGATKTCWHCNSVVNALDFFCSCGKIQNLPDDLQYFDLFGFSDLQVDIDDASLSKTKKKLQFALHPDRFTSFAPEEKVKSATASSHVNNAYAVLRDRVKRYAYILKLKGFTLKEDSSRATNESEFLSVLLELSEQAAEFKAGIEGICEESAVEYETEINAFASAVVAKYEHELSETRGYLLAEDYAAAVIHFSRANFYNTLLESLRELQVDLKLKGVTLQL